MAYLGNIINEAASTWKSRNVKSRRSTKSTGKISPSSNIRYSFVILSKAYIFHIRHNISLHSDTLHVKKPYHNIYIILHQRKNVVLDNCFNVSYRNQTYIYIDWWRKATESKGSYHILKIITCMYLKPGWTYLLTISLL